MSLMDALNNVYEFFPKIAAIAGTTGDNLYSSAQAGSIFNAFNNENTWGGAKFPTSTSNDIKGAARGYRAWLAARFGATGDEDISAYATQTLPVIAYVAQNIRRVSGSFPAGYPTGNADTGNAAWIRYFDDLYQQGIADLQGGGYQEAGLPAVAGAVGSMLPSLGGNLGADLIQRGVNWLGGGQQPVGLGQYYHQTCAGQYRPMKTVVVQMPNGKFAWFEYKGKPVLWSGDLSTVKRVSKVARIAVSRLGKTVQPRKRRSRRR